jgi:hypothetical protein
LPFQLSVWFSELLKTIHTGLVGRVKVKVKVALRGLFSTAALKADCTLAPEIVPSFISRGAPHQAARKASTSEGRKLNTRILPAPRNFTAGVGVLLHAPKLGHGADYLTSPPKEGMLRIFISEKSNGFGRV